MTHSWRQATDDEIIKFYEQEFPPSVGGFPKFITPTSPKEFGVQLSDYYPRQGNETAKTDFIRRQTRPDGNASVFTCWEDVARFAKAPAENDPLVDSTNDGALADPILVDGKGPVTNALYFGVDTHDHGWPLYVDIDAKDIAINRAQEAVDQHGGLDKDRLLAKAGIIQEEPEGFNYGFRDIRQALEYGFEVAEYFEETLNGDSTTVVYSGQGAHVYLADDDPDHRYDRRARQVIIQFLTEQEEFPIDEVVTADRRRFGRVPYSLHTDICRVPQPVDSPEFDFVNDAKPEFLA